VLLIGAIITAALATKASERQVPWDGQVISLLLLLGKAIWAPALYLLAGVGLGMAMVDLMRGRAAADAEDQPMRGAQAALAACVGLSIMLTLTHLLGWLGALGGPLGGIVAWVPIALGLGAWLPMLARLVRDPRQITLRTPVASLLLIVPIAVLITASLAPPGWLWASEYGGYDSLSYHLQLPQEWLALGRITPVEHNVYSFHPLYIESAFYHLGVMTAAPLPSVTARVPNEPWGLAAWDGWRLISCHLLHAGLTILAAWAIGQLATRWLTRPTDTQASPPIDEPPGPTMDRNGWLAWIISAIVLATPWTVVVGSLAYNEMGLMLLFAGAMLAAIDHTMSPAWRWGLAGWLVGVACGCKATALLFAGVPVGLVLMASTPRTSVPKGLLIGIIAGVMALAPWLVRNAQVSGNPVFPAASGFFGQGHWNQEQVERFARAHTFSGSLVERVSLMVKPDTSDPMASAASPVSAEGQPKAETPSGVHRGLAHPQWGVFFLACAAACVVGLARGATRTWIILPIAALIIQLVLWLGVTHIQSRFLIPMIVPGALLLATAFGGLWPARLASGLLVLLAILQTAWLARLFMLEQGGEASRLLPVGPGAFSGQAFRAGIERLPGVDRESTLSQSSAYLYTAVRLQPIDKLLLMADGAPLYFSCQTVYTTTWDTSPLIRVIREHPSAPNRWTPELRASGITHMLVHVSELDRLMRSGFVDPALAPFSEPGSVQDQWARSHPIVHAWPGSILLIDLRMTNKAPNQAPAQAPVPR
jgi:hypothetical protein